MSRLIAGILAIVAAGWAGSAAWGGDLDAVMEQTNKTRQALAVDGVKAMPEVDTGTDLARAMKELDAQEVPKKRSAPAPGWVGSTKEQESAKALEAALGGADATSSDVELARALHREGLYERAAEIYKRALEKAKGDEKQEAWLLLMLGDCQMRTDVQAASATYKKLATEHVDSPWRQFALFRAKLLLWELSEPSVREIEGKEEK